MYTYWLIVQVGYLGPIAGLERFFSSPSPYMIVRLQSLPTDNTSFRQLL